MSKLFKRELLFQHPKGFEGWQRYGHLQGIFQKPDETKGEYMARLNAHFWREQGRRKV
jgi:hypothetical protein